MGSQGGTLDIDVAFPIAGYLMGWQAGMLDTFVTVDTLTTFVEGTWILLESG